TSASRPSPKPCARRCTTPETDTGHFRRPSAGRGDTTMPSTTTNGSKKRVDGHETAPLVAEALDRRTLLAALRAYQRGDFGVRLPDSLDGIDGQICAVFNDIAQSSARLGDDASALAVAVVEEGRTKRRLRKNGLRGSWSAFVDANNAMLDGLTNHMSEISRVVKSVANGNLRERMDE